MKYFIYTYSEGKPPRDGSGILKTVRIYEVRKNIPTLICSYSDNFVSEWQLVMQALEQAEALPPATFHIGPSGSYEFANQYCLRVSGIAHVSKV